MPQRAVRSMQASQAQAIFEKFIPQIGVKPVADLIEVAVYNAALNKDLQTKVLNSMWDHYFKK